MAPRTWDRRGRGPKPQYPRRGPRRPSLWGCSPQGWAALPGRGSWVAGSRGLWGRDSAERGVPRASGLTGVSGAAASPRTWPTPPGLGSWTRNGWESCPPPPKGQSHGDGAKPPTQKPFALAGQVQAAQLTTCSACRSRRSFSRRCSALSSMAAGGGGPAQTEPPILPRVALLPLLLRPLLPPLLRRPRAQHFRPHGNPVSNRPRSAPAARQPIRACARSGSAPVDAHWCRRPRFRGGFGLLAPARRGCPNPRCCSRRQGLSPD